jgi:hypothetical protein
VDGHAADRQALGQLVYLQRPVLQDVLGDPGLAFGLVEALTAVIYSYLHPLSFEKKKKTANVTIFVILTYIM